MPKTEPAATIAAQGGIYLISDGGDDWYESQQLFSPDTWKVVFDEQGNVTSVSKDVSLLYPINLSVAEVNELPEGFKLGDEWIFDGVCVKEKPLSKEDIINQVNDKKAELLKEANEAISIWQTELQLGIISDSDKKKLIQWLGYIKEINAIDVNANPILWPEKPSEV